MNYPLFTFLNRRQLFLHSGQKNRILVYQSDTFSKSFLDPFLFPSLPCTSLEISFMIKVCLECTKHRRLIHWYTSELNINLYMRFWIVGRRAYWFFTAYLWILEATQKHHGYPWGESLSGPVASVHLFHSLPNLHFREAVHH